MPTRRHAHRFEERKLTGRRVLSAPPNFHCSPIVPHSLTALVTSSWCLRQLPPNNSDPEGITFPRYTSAQTSEFDLLKTTNEELEQIIKILNQWWKQFQIRWRISLSPSFLKISEGESFNSQAPTLMLQISIPLPIYLNWLPPKPSPFWLQRNILVSQSPWQISKRLLQFLKCGTCFMSSAPFNSSLFSPPLALV